MSVRRHLVFAGLLGLLGSGCLTIGGLDGGASGNTDGPSDDDGDDADDADGKNGAGGDSGYTAEPGSCDAWKIGYCDAVDECGSVAEKRSCRDDVGYVACLEGSAYGSCGNTLASLAKKGECSEWPRACEPQDLADRTQPYDTCVRLYRAICEWRQYCNPLGGVEDCQMEMEASQPCAGFFAVDADVAESCISGYQVAACGESPPYECLTERFLKK